MRFALLLLFTVASTLKPQEFPTPLPGQFTTPPKLIHKVEPQYTRSALKAKLEGYVVLRVLVGADGIPSHITISRGLGKGLDRKAIECLKRWRFRPAMRFDQPIPTTIEVEMNFRLPPGQTSQ
ncbi:MAG TPA: energy transducer TonB [Bryobacteraceae bacterium]|nr:energy transducer TonB [Bryobacteraceae bacterium]